jgi:hypothetical protein
VPSALVIFPLLTVIDTWTSPYWVLTAWPVNVPDFPAGAPELGAAVVGAGVGFLLGAGVVERDGVVLGAVAGDDGFGVLFAADFDRDALARVLAVGEVIGPAVIVGVAGDVLATATPATCVL